MFRATSRLRFIEPQLASPADQPPEGKHWIHEIKHDGYRSQVVIERGQVRSLTGMDMIGATAIMASSALLLVSAANQQSLMARLSCRMAMAVLTSSRFNRP